MDDKRLFQEDPQLDDLRQLLAELDDMRNKQTDVSEFEIKVLEQEVLNEMIRVTAATGELVEICQHCGDPYFEKLGCDCDKWVPASEKNMEWDEEETTTSEDPLPYFDANNRNNVIDLNQWRMKKRK